ncbi:toprim domain-containing protein [Rhizobium leguminosarum]|nr:toprim domain-containing protein [Rhizobium leguminosarum]
MRVTRDSLAPCPRQPVFQLTRKYVCATYVRTLRGQLGRDGTLYLSTGGGWSPATQAALRELAARPDAQLVAATDANSQGDLFAERLRALAEDTGCDWTRLRPPKEDWNETLKVREKQKLERKESGVPQRQGKASPGGAVP